MTNPLIFAGTIGAEVLLVTASDLVTGVLEVTIEVKKPNGTQTVWVPTDISDSNENWIITYSTVEGDLDQAGNYLLQPKIVMRNGDVWYLETVAWMIYQVFDLVARPTNYGSVTVFTW